MTEVWPRDVIVGDVVLLEVLQGARNDDQAAVLRRRLQIFRNESLLTSALAVKAAANYRRLREVGVTIRKGADLLIGTYCIENDHALLHNDRDFDAMVAHLGLRLA